MGFRMAEKRCQCPLVLQEEHEEKQMRSPTSAEPGQHEDAVTDIAVSCSLMSAEGRTDAVKPPNESAPSAHPGSLPSSKLLRLAGSSQDHPALEGLQGHALCRQRNMVAVHDSLCFDLNASAYGGDHVAVFVLAASV